MENRHDVCLFFILLGSIWKPGIWPTARDFSPAEAIFPQEYFVYYKGKWCTAGGKDPLFGHVDGFQIDPISWAAPHNSARSLRQDFCPNSKFGKRRNTACISRFSNWRSGAKRRLRLADTIVRCCPRENRKEIKPGSAWEGVAGGISPGHWQFQQFLVQLFMHTARLTCYEKSSILFLKGSVKKIIL